MDRECEEEHKGQNAVLGLVTLTVSTRVADGALWECLKIDETKAKKKKKKKNIKTAREELE